MENSLPEETGTLISHPAKCANQWGTFGELNRGKGGKEEEHMPAFLNLSVH